MIKVVPLYGATNTRAARDEILDEARQRTLGHITSMDGELYAAYALTPVDDEHKNGLHVVPGVGRQTAIDLVVMMHRYWTLPASEKEEK